MDIINSIIKNKTECYFISPHLDDAALSAGGLITYLSGKTKINVVTVFTKSGIVSSLSAKKFLKQMGNNKGEKLFKQREKEDDLAFEKIGVKTIHLGFVDALWRKKSKNNIFFAMLGKLMPEFALINPTYKLHISQGRILKEDQATVKRVAKRIAQIIGRKSGVVIFCPIGVGGHVDHMITKSAVESIKRPIYWLDQPYLFRNNKAKMDKSLLQLTEFPINQKKKKNLLSQYKTQVNVLFDNGIIPNLEERFFKSNMKVLI